MEGIISTRETVNYDSKTHAVDSKTPGSFSIRFLKVVRNLIRSGGSDRRETLLSQRTIESPAIIGLEIPACFLAGEEICRGYVAYALSKTIIDDWIQRLILAQICKDAIQEGKRSGFMVEAQVEAIQETYFDKCYDLSDYDAQGELIPTEPDCPICLQDFDPEGGIITKLRCCDHWFHRNCILTWLARKPSCPTCRDDIHNPRPRRFTQNALYLRRNTQTGMRFDWLV